MASLHTGSGSLAASRAAHRPLLLALALAPLLLLFALLLAELNAPTLEALEGALVVG
ncbi:hypothetical protein AB0K49_25350 [Streptomyces decoyicus]|uniref:hypothetical protein n=1 Tax=Streptomyces decoyicus TaxID=249567 RepID=UPI00345CFC9F